MHKPSLALLLSLVASAAAAADTIDAGLYEIVTKANVGPAQTVQKCFSAADVVKGFTATDLPKECKVIRSTVGGGKVEYAATCPDMTMTMTGTYTSTGYQITGKTKIKSDDDDPAMTIESNITAKKIGACKG
jgi:Protein of unknown function (DUF3617)